jgi:hypothetical protein
VNERRLPLSSGDRRRLAAAPAHFDFELPPGLSIEAPGFANAELKLVEEASNLLPFPAPPNDKIAEGAEIPVQRRFGIIPYPAQSGADSREQARRVRERNLRLF